MAKQKTTTNSKNNDNSKLCAALSYLLIGIIWYFVDEKMKRNNFVKFHVKQGLLLLIIAIIYSVIVGILTFPLHFIPVLGTIIIWMLNIVGLIFLVLAILGIINALNNEEKALPIIGEKAKSVFTF